MKANPYLWSGLVVLLGMVSPVIAQGQPPGQPPVPRYYPGTISPAPGSVQAPAMKPHPQMRKELQAQRPNPNTAPPPQARLTQPVIAGPEGVNLLPVASTNDPSMPTPVLPATGAAPPVLPTTPQPGLADPETPSFFPPPAVTLEPESAPTGMPPVPTSPTVPMAPPVGPVPTLPSTPVETNYPSSINPALSPAATAISAAAAKQTPTVHVEMEAPESVSVGQPLVYHLVVRNLGQSTVENVRIEHQLPVGTSFISSEPVADGSQEGKMAWALGSLDATSEKRIKVTIKPLDEGQLLGRTTVSFQSVVETKIQVTRPRIQVTLTGPEVMRVGENVPLTVKLTNVGTGPAVKLGLQARFSEGLKHSNGNFIEAEVQNLPAGESKSFVLNVTAMKPGQQNCVLTAFADGNPPETAKATVNLVEPQLIAKQTGPSKCLVHSEPIFQIDLSNPGTAATDPVQVWSQVPEGFEFVQASDGGSYHAESKSVQWKLTSLQAGGSKAISMKLRAVAPADGVVRTAAVTATDNVPGAAKGKPLDSRTETPIKSEGVPALRFEVIDMVDPVIVGKEATYEIKVVNQGTGACNTVQLHVEMADGTEMIASTGPTTGRAQGQVIVFEPIAQLPVKGEALYKVRIKGNVEGDKRFRVHLTCEQIRNPVVKEENTRFYKE